MPTTQTTQTTQTPLDWSQMIHHIAMREFALLSFIALLPNIEYPEALFLTASVPYVVSLVIAVTLMFLYRFMILFEGDLMPDLFVREIRKLATKMRHNSSARVTFGVRFCFLSGALLCTSL
jgi:hypothetical protein